MKEIDRHTFLEASALLILGEGKGPKSSIIRVEDAFVIECGALHCVAEKGSLEFTIYVRRNQPHGHTVRRMLPSETLRSRLRAVGLDTDYSYLSLVGKAGAWLTLPKLQRKIEIVMARGNWGALYVDTTPQDWDRLSSHEAYARG